MDAFDYKIIKLLMANGRMTWADLASQVGLSAPAVAERVNRLQANGVITGICALIDGERVGAECTAFVAVTLEKPQFREAFLEQVNALEEVQECHHIAGDDDYLLKIRCRNTKDLDRVISYGIKGLHGVLRTRTTIVMDTLKETVQIPLQEDAFAAGGRGEHGH